MANSNVHSVETETGKLNVEPAQVAVVARDSITEQGIQRNLGRDVRACHEISTVGLD